MKQGLETLSFSGGYKFKNFAGQAPQKLEEFTQPASVVIPVNQCNCKGSELLVKTGDAVVAGQMLARCNECGGSPALASICGEVAEIRPGMFDSTSVDLVTINANGRADISKLEGFGEKFAEKSPTIIHELLYRSGAALISSPAFPAGAQKSGTASDELEEIIIHHTDAEPYSVQPEILLQEKGLDRFVKGVKILRLVYAQARLNIVFSTIRSELAAKVSEQLSRIINTRVITVVPKYPQGSEDALYSALFGTRLSADNRGKRKKSAYLDMQGVIAVAEAVIDGSPAIEQTIALCGPGFKDPVHLRVRFGTKVEDVVRDRLSGGKVRLVLNSLLTGTSIIDLQTPICKNARQIIAIPEGNEREFLAFGRPGIDTDSFSCAFVAPLLGLERKPTTNMRGEERPCVQCGNCSNLCPAQLIPTFINRKLKLGIDDRLVDYGIMDCIECNLCSYGCLAKIPLGKNLKDAKSELLKQKTHDCDCKTDEQTAEPAS